MFGSYPDAVPARFSECGLGVVDFYRKSNSTAGEIRRAIKLSPRAFHRKMHSGQEVGGRRARWILLDGAVQRQSALQRVARISILERGPPKPPLELVVSCIFRLLHIWCTLGHSRVNFLRWGGLWFVVVIFTWINHSFVEISTTLIDKVRTRRAMGTSSARTTREERT